MTSEPGRRSIRLREHDYTKSGLYFVTICTHERQNLFGEIVTGSINHSPLGDLVRVEWERTPQLREGVQLGPFVIMPNHLHAIVALPDSNLIPMPAPQGKHRSNLHFHSPSRSLGALIRGFKAAVTTAYTRGIISPVKIWQRNYYEHVIRDEKSYRVIAEYIENNPFRWYDDELFVG